MADEKIYIEYPTARIGEERHITVNYGETLCGKTCKYQPIRFKWWHEIECEKCRELSKGKEYSDIPKPQGLSDVEFKKLMDKQDKDFEKFMKRKSKELKL